MGIEEYQRLAGGSGQREHGRPPLIYRRKTRARDLVVTVNAFESGNPALPADVVIIQGFREENGKYILANETLDALLRVFREYHPQQMLRSPNPREPWGIIGGQVSRFLGHLDRARVYGFDGHRFRDPWAPEDHEQMEIVISADEIQATNWGREDSAACFLAPGLHGKRMNLTPTGLLRTALVNHREVKTRQ
jgi:hypothetical protein